ncbi:glycosyl transferase family 1 [Thiocystis minor]|nr:glycosyl transferase family 1 [Thiocystis minor]
MQRSICFVGMDNYPVLNPEFGQRYFGGESVQQTLLAYAFRDLGLDVSMVVLDYGQPDGEVIDGIRVWKSYREHSGIPIIRFLHPKATSIIAALRKAKSDIYYQSCSGALTGLVSWYCRRNDRSFIYRVASDADCIPELPLIHYGRDRALYRYGLKGADFVAAQSHHQASLLMDSFNRSSGLVNMAVEIPHFSDDRQIDIDVLWVNNFRPLKRPQQVLQLAKRLTQHRFVMVGGPVPGNEDFYREIATQAREIPNLEMVGAVPYKSVTEYFLRSRILINTSEIEGFPNSILQAWASRLPVISYFDPDGLNQRLDLGSCPKNFEEMVLAIEKYLEDTALHHETGTRARHFVTENYSPEAVARCYLDQIRVTGSCPS